MTPEQASGLGPVVWLEEVDSTNDELRRGGYPPGTVVAAVRQTAGRGRRNHRWHSVAGESLTFSALLAPGVPLALWPRLSLAAGLATAEALESMGYAVGIKWPNDLWIGGRKVAGILVESTDAGAVVGIGVNLAMREFEPGLDATSLLLEDHRRWEPGEVLEILLARLSLWTGRIGADFEALIAGVRQRCVLAGREVVLRTSRGEMRGRVVEIGAKGELLLETGEGIVPVIQAEEVRPVGPGEGL